MTSRRGSERRRWALPGSVLLWIAVVVALLVILDVVLVVTALGRTAPADNGIPGPIPTFTSVPSPGATPSATPTTAATPAAASEAAPARFLSVVSPTQAWRATAGSCSGPDPVIERTTDAGASWTPASISSYGVHRVDGLAAGTAKTSIVAGVGASCTDAALSSYTSGQFWAPDASGLVAGSVTQDGRIRLGASTLSSPCAHPQRVVAGPSNDAVLCEGVLVAKQGAGNWVTVPVAGLSAVVLDGSGYTLAITGAAGCSGVEIATLPGAGLAPTSAPTRVGCVPLKTLAGGIAIGRRANAVWLWSGEQVLVSKDGGATW
jgi:hypothetical protein